MGPIDKIEEYFAFVEEYFFSSISSVANGLPDVHEVADRLWIDISRYGPGLPALPQVHIPSLGDFQVPPPPPPPPRPPAMQWLETSSDWIIEHPWSTTGLMVSAIGTSLLAGYRIMHSKKRGSQRLRTQKSKPFVRRQVVVVLGADSPFGLPLVLDLERKGYIVVVSVSTLEAAESLERQTQGYVKAIVLDPYEPLMIPGFLRSLSATLARKFPINAAGDPFASVASHSYIYSIISLLTLPTDRKAIQTLAPLEHISLPETYLPYLMATHITPLQIIQAMLPLLRTNPAMIHDHRLTKTVIVCLPATDVRMGLPFAGVKSMSAAAMERGIDVLRREIRAAAVNGKGAEAMRNVRVVVVDVGTFDVGNIALGDGVQTETIWKKMEGWTASEKVTYGPAFASTLQGLLSVRPTARRTAWEAFVGVLKGTSRYGAPRKPTDVSVFVGSVVDVVSGGRGVYKVFGIGFGLGRVINWMKGERFSIGAGAHTYKFASYLPSVILDMLINIPHYLIGVRNRLLTTQPFRRPPSNSPPPSIPPRPASTAASQTPARSDLGIESKGDASTSGHDDVSSETDTESVNGSWINLDGSQPDVERQVSE